MTIDQDKLTDFLHKFVGDLGATMAAGNVLVGDRLGFYRALAGHPMLPTSSPSTPAPPPATSMNGSAARRRAATWNTTPAPGTTP